MILQSDSLGGTLFAMREHELGEHGTPAVAVNAGLADHVGELEASIDRYKDSYAPEGDSDPDWDGPR